MASQVRITVKNGATDEPLTGATVRIAATSTGQSNAKTYEAFDKDPEAIEAGALSEEKTETVGDICGTAVFLVADWVTEMKITADHERFSENSISMAPSPNTTEAEITISPDVEDVSITASEYLPEQAQVKIEPVDEVVEKLYNETVATIEVDPGATRDITLTEGRYRFELKNPPENYTGKTSVAKNLEQTGPADISFSGMDIDEPLEQAAGDSNAEEDDSSDDGMFSGLGGLFSRGGSESEPDSEPDDPVSTEDVEAEPAPAESKPMAEDSATDRMETSTIDTLPDAEEVELEDISTEDAETDMPDTSTGDTESDTTDTSTPDSGSNTEDNAEA